MNTIYDGSFVLGQTSAENPSLLVNENSEGNVSILQGTVATSAGIVGDGTTQNPLRADETVLWSGNFNPGGTTSYVDLSEPISAFNEIGVYTNFENMYGPKLTRFDTQNVSWSLEPNTNVYLLGVADAYSLKPQESNTLYRAYYSFGCSTDYSKMYFLGGHLYMNGGSGNIYNQFTGLCWLNKVIGINRKAQ